MSENVLNIDPSIDLKQCLLWQYQNSPRLKSLILSKQEWYQTHQADFWQEWYDNVFNLDTANDFGLSVWGQILDFSRNVTAKDGSVHSLTTEQYRMVLKGQVLKFGMGCSAPEVNKWLSVVFAGKANIFCLDPLDMTAIPFVMRSAPTPEISWLLGNIDFFPRPAGVGYEVRIIPNNVFGFRGSGMQTFNNGVFANDYSDIIAPSDPDMFQVSINAPSGATVTIDGENKSWALIEKNETFSWAVSQSGYITASGTGTVQGDISINISRLRINNNTGVGTVYINSQTAIGAFFQTGTQFSFQYSVGAGGFIPLSGNGVISNDRTIDVSRLLINPTPSDASVLLNGQPANGAFFETGDVFEYEYTVSYPGLIPASGSGYVTESQIINASVKEGKYQIKNITTNAAGIEEIGAYTVSTNGSASLILAAEMGKGFLRSSGGYGARATISNIPLTDGDVLKFVKVNGAENAGCGLAMYINNSLKLVVGGGAGYQDAGGGGYIGGAVGYASNPSGYSIDGNRGNSKSNNLNNGDGGSFHQSYGGSGYNGFNDISVNFSQNQAAGYVELTFEPI